MDLIRKKDSLDTFDENFLSFQHKYLTFSFSSLKLCGLWKKARNTKMKKNASLKRNGETPIVPFVNRVGQYSFSFVLICSLP